LASHKHLYADDTQIIGRCRPTEIDNFAQRMSACLDELANWILSNRLQLNPDKTELLWYSTTRRLKSLQLQSIRVGYDIIELSDCVCDLGVYIECDLTMRSNILKVAGGCYSVLRQLRSVRRSVPTVFCMLVGLLVVS
jgi:hypothetical protein